MNKKIAALIASALLLVLPSFTLAAVTIPAHPGPITGASVWLVVNGIISLIWPVFFGVSIIMFIMAGFIYVTALGDPGKVKLARNSFIAGIVGVIIAVLAISLPYLIICVVVTTCGAPASGTGSTPAAPAAPTDCGNATTPQCNGTCVNGSCQYDATNDVCTCGTPDDTTTGQVSGCTDPNADNYNAAATEDDGSCVYDQSTNGSSGAGTPGTTDSGDGSNGTPPPSINNSGPSGLISTPGS